MPVLTLASDFGTRDGYVGQMLGVLACEAPAGTQLVQLTHQLPRQDVTAAALFAEAVYRRFPPGSTHLLVVDPGVGSARRALMVEADGQRFVGPDNGVFSLCWGRTPTVCAIDLARLPNRAAAGTRLSSTFHGRDVFAPVAARLAHGVPLAQFGPPVHDPVTLQLPAARYDGDQALGEVLHVDHFGNCITNLRADGLTSAIADQVLTVPKAGLRLPLQDHYAQVAVGAPIALVDSAGRLEVAVRDGSAAHTLGLERGDQVMVELSDRDSL